MGWQLNVGGTADTQADESGIIDKIEAFLSGIGDHWHSITTDFHGVGDVGTLRQNVQQSDPSAVNSDAELPPTQPDPQTVNPDTPPVDTPPPVTPDPVAGVQGPSSEGAS